MVILGWISSLVLLLAYFLISTERVTRTSKLYHTMCGAGAAGFCIVGIDAHLWSWVTLNSLFVAVAIYALMRPHRAS